MGMSEFKRKFRNALEYHHGRYMDDDEMDELTQTELDKIDIDNRHVQLMGPYRMARHAGHKYLAERDRGWGLE